MARRAHPVVRAGGRAGLARQSGGSHLRTAASGAVVRPVGQYRLQERRGRPLPGRPRNPLPYPPGFAPGEEGGTLDHGGRTGRNHTAVRALRRPARCGVAG
ncbi:hypothetical protein G6F57_023675 [Rhizopus arrhizus]|nr:hypothetical protein G6F57_023675 [Rhizopus arrhizus]